MNAKSKRERVKRARRIATLAVCGALGLFAVLAEAETFPTKPIRFIINSAPGGAPDIIGRSVAQRLTEQVGQQIVVDNRAGGSGVIAAELVAKAAPDGYTALLGATTIFAMLPAMRSKLPYDVERDFAPVMLLASAANVVAVNAGLPVRSIGELVAMAKSKPLLYGSAGIGTPAHLAGEMLNLLAGSKIGHVPYKGAGPALIEVIAGQIHLIITSPIAAGPHASTGKVRLLATTGTQRNPVFPELPTVAETLPGYEITQWWGMAVPRKTPHSIVMQLNQALAKVLAHPELSEHMKRQGAVLGGGMPEDFTRFISAERARLGGVIRRAGIRLDN